MTTPHQSADAYEEPRARARESDRRVADTEDAATDGAHRSFADRHTVVNREKERCGGVKIGSAFFGSLTATSPRLVWLFEECGQADDVRWPVQARLAARRGVPVAQQWPRETGGSRTVPSRRPAASVDR